jgi:hypothetical protein
MIRPEGGLSSRRKGKFIRVSSYFFVKHHYGHQIKENKMTGTCVASGIEGSVYETSVAEAERRTILAEHTRRWEDEIKIDLNEIRCKGMD